MNRKTELRTPVALCATPNMAKCCGECRRNPDNLSAGTWSETPSVRPVKREHGGCADFYAVPSR